MHVWFIQILDPRHSVYYVVLYVCEVKVKSSFFLDLGLTFSPPRPSPRGLNS